jgi:hypothetical protein
MYLDPCEIIKKQKNARSFSTNFRKAFFDKISRRFLGGAP